MFDDSDDDGPVVFKRSSASSKQSLGPSTKKSSSQRHDARPDYDTRSSDPHNSSSQNGKTMSSTKPSSLKSPAISPVASTSSAAVAAPVKSPAMDSKVSTLSADRSKPSPRKNTSATVVKEERVRVEPLAAHRSYGSPKMNASSSLKEDRVEPPAAENSNSEDSEDDKPLSVRMTTGILKASPIQANEELSMSPPVSSLVQKSKVSMKEESSEDSDDEIPLSYRFQPKSSAGTSISKQYGYDEKKPLVSKLHQNGSVERSSQLGKSSTNKRPLGDANSVGQSSVKKLKLQVASAPIKAKQVSVKAEMKAEDDDHVPIGQRMKKAATSDSKSSLAKQKATKVVSSSFKKTVKSKKMANNSKYSKSTTVPPGSGEGQKWTTLVHNGVIFPPPYTPHGVKMLYDKTPVDLTPAQEEVATMFAVMKDTDYATKPRFIENFMNDWRKLLGKNHVIKDFSRCDFTPIYDWHQKEKEKKKQMSADEKKALKEEKMKQEEKFMWAIVDGVKEKVGNFRVEPPGLFRGRGEHPKMGMLKKRIRPSDITLNIGKGAPIPECPIPGESWKEIKHDNTVTWLAFWNDPINSKEFKYVFLAASSSLKGQSDKEKYEKARLLKNYIQGIRTAYTKDFASKDVTKRQIAVATYLIDKLALRAGNEKDDDEADTVGCCTLKVDNVIPKPPNILKFDFLGKDSIRYENEVEVELPVYKAIEQFQKGKSEGDDLFDKLDTSKLNAHLKELMPGLTAKVFRTYNASITLDDMLHKETKDGIVAEKVVVYQQANKQVAIICNHQRTVSKSHSAQMSKLTEKIDELKAIVEDLRTDLARAKKGKPPLKDADGKQKRNLSPEAIQKKIQQTNVKIEKMELNKQTKEDLKTVALGTSKINYLDPRITVAWCKRHEVPIEKLFNKSLLAKFAWSMDVDPDFRF